MIVELTQDAEGPAGLLPAGTRIDHPLAYVHIARGIAKPVDEEAAEAGEIERLAMRARAQSRRKKQADARRKSLERQRKVADARRKRLKERIRAEAEVIQEVRAELAAEPPAYPATDRTHDHHPADLDPQPDSGRQG